jgi:hypothetical protein
LDLYYYTPDVELIEESSSLIKNKSLQEISITKDLTITYRNQVVITSCSQFVFNSFII